METPDDFVSIEPQLYWASRLQAHSFRLVASLRLKQILVLDPGSPPASLVAFTEQNQIELVHLGTQPWLSLSDATQQHSTWHVLSQAMQHLLDTRNYPLLVVDTSVLIGIVRRLQHWPISAILWEYVTLNGVRANYSAELFIENVRLGDRKPDDADDEDASDAAITPLVTIEPPAPEFWPRWYSVLSKPECDQIT